MAQLPNPAIIVADGTYDIQHLGAAKLYLILLKGVFGGASIALSYLDPVSDLWVSIENGTIAGEFEDHLRAPSSQLRLTVTGAGGTTAISVNLVQIPQP